MVTNLEKNTYKATLASFNRRAALPNVHFEALPPKLPLEVHKIMRGGGATTRGRIVDRQFSWTKQLKKTIMRPYSDRESFCFISLTLILNFILTYRRHLEPMLISVINKEDFFPWTIFPADIFFTDIFPSCFSCGFFFHVYIFPDYQFNHPVNLECDMEFCQKKTFEMFNVSFVC